MKGQIKTEKELSYLIQGMLRYLVKRKNIKDFPYSILDIHFSLFQLKNNSDRDRKFLLAMESELFGKGVVWITAIESIFNNFLLDGTLGWKKSRYVINIDQMKSWEEIMPELERKISRAEIETLADTWCIYLK